jgi:hypothetical protein
MNIPAHIAAIHAAEVLAFRATRKAANAKERRAANIAFDRLKGTTATAIYELTGGDQSKYNAMREALEALSV